METIFSEDRNPGNTYIAFFDLDRTITKEISGKAIAKAAFRNGHMSRSDLLRAIYLSMLYKLNLKDPSQIIEDMVSWVKGMTESTMSGLCSEVFNEVLKPSVYSEARAEIKIHKDKNAKVVLLSSALTPICLKMSEDLGIDDIICSDLEVKDGYMTGRSCGRLCFGEEKMVRLKKYCEKNNTEISDTWYYGDSISDLPALSSVGHPVCVNPDNKLKRAANKRGWKTLKWHN